MPYGRHYGFVRYGFSCQTARSNIVRNMMECINNWHYQRPMNTLSARTRVAGRDVPLAGGECPESGGGGQRDVMAELFELVDHASLVGLTLTANLPVRAEVQGASSRCSMWNAATRMECGTATWVQFIPRRFVRRASCADR